MNDCQRCGKNITELRASCFNCFAPLNLTPEEYAALKQKLDEAQALLLANENEKEVEKQGIDETSRSLIVGEIFDDLAEEKTPWWKKMFEKNGEKQQKYSTLQTSEADPKRKKHGINKDNEVKEEESSLVNEQEMARRMKEAKEQEAKDKKERAAQEKERKRIEKERNKKSGKKKLSESLLEDDVPVEILRGAINAAINTIEANTSTDFSDILSSYINLKRAQQTQIVGELYNNFNIIANPQGYAQLINSALARYSRAVQNNSSEADVLLEFINVFGYGNNYFNAATVSYLADQRNYVAAIHMLKFLLKTYQYDSVMHAELYNVVDNLQGQITPPIKRTMRETFLTELSPQYARRYRHRYFYSLVFSQNASDKEQFTSYGSTTDRLVLAEYNLASNDTMKATTIFYDVAVNSAEILGRRLAAFSGLTDSGIKEAISVIPYLTDEILSRPDSPERTCNIRWYGLEVGKMLVKLASNENEHTDINAKDAYIAGAAALGKMIKSNPIASLRGENHNGKSLRQSAALLYSLAGMEKEMNDVIDMRIEYTDFPQAGTENGATYKEINELIKYISPNHTEPDAIRNSVRVAMSQYRSAK